MQPLRGDNEDGAGLRVDRRRLALEAALITASKNAQFIE